MKTERCHELQTNWLADRVGEVLLVTKPYMKAIVGLLLAGVVLWGAFLFMAHQREVAKASSWNKLWDGLRGGATAVEDLQSLADTHAKQPASEWAQLILADNALSGGVSEWFTEKAAGRNMINSALDMYQSVFNNSTDPLVREHALFGIGRSYESLCKVPEAQKAYEQLRKDFPNSSYAARAKARFDSLERDSVQARYDWFAKLEAPPNVFGKNGEKLGDKNSLTLPPELEPLSEFGSKSKTPPPEPKPDTGAKTPKESKPGETKAGETKAPATPKATESSKSKEAKPAEAKPAEAKSAETKPAETKPAETKPAAPKSSTTKPATPPPATDGKTPTDSKAAPAPTSDKKS